VLRFKIVSSSNKEDSWICDVTIGGSLESQWGFKPNYEHADPHHRERCYKLLKDLGTLRIKASIILGERPQDFQFDPNTAEESSPEDEKDRLMSYL
jgi:hypothetical protein